MKFSQEEYRRRIDALFARFQSVQAVGFTSDSYKPGLDGMLALDSATGSPHKAYRCIHVAGTNGKGSVCSMIAAALASKGMIVGLYTSPHLLDFRERIKVINPGRGAQLIRQESVWDFLEKYQGSTDGHSFFEITTGMAFWWFREQGVDAAVIETGLGGRLDSTNIITPELSIVTSIGLDHCAILGNTRAEIAAEKAGIFKTGVPAVVWGRDEETTPVFEQAAAAVSTAVTYADSFPSLPGEKEVLPLMDLRGDAQKVNLHTALTALSLILPGLDAGVFRAIAGTAATSGLKGRWEIIGERPEVICDIGHNPQALSVNFSQLEKLGKKMTVVYGVMADKDLGTIASLMPAGARYIFTSPAVPRALPAERLLDTVRKIRPELSARCIPDVGEAVREACSQAGPDELVFIGGSTFVVSEALSGLGQT